MTNRSRLARRFCAFNLLCFSILCFHASSFAGESKELDQLSKQAAVAKVPLAQLPEPVRGKVAFVLQKAQIFEKGKTEAFPCKPDIYRWLLDSPDASLYAWKQLGATKASITKQVDGTFHGSDGSGGELRWQLVSADPKLRIWYAEGSGRMGPFLPTMTIRALVLLSFQEVKSYDGRAGMKHRLELFANYDSTPIITRLTGMSAESIGKKAVQQMEVFFSGMAWYASEHAQWSKSTFSQWASTPENKTRVDPFLHLIEATQTENREPLPIKTPRQPNFPK